MMFHVSILQHQTCTTRAGWSETQQWGFWGCKLQTLLTGDLESLQRAGAQLAGLGQWSVTCPAQTLQHAALQHPGEQWAVAPPAADVSPVISAQAAGTRQGPTQALQHCSTSSAVAADNLNISQQPVRRCGRQAQITKWSLIELNGVEWSWVELSRYKY